MNIVRELDSHPIGHAIMTSEIELNIMVSLNPFLNSLFRIFIFFHFLLKTIVFATASKSDGRRNGFQNRFKAVHMPHKHVLNSRGLFAILETELRAKSPFGIPLVSLDSICVQK